MKFGRAVKLVTTKAEHRDFKVGLEAVESYTGRLLDLDAAYEGDGVAFEAGDILFGKLRPYLAKSWLADRPGAAVGDFHVYRVRPDVAAPRYLRYVTLSRSFLDPVISSVFGAKMPRASWDFVREIETFLPSSAMQREIADYLDRETAQIDTLIAKQEQLIASLEQRRMSTIADAVLENASPLDLNAGSPFVRIGYGCTVTLGKMLDAGKQRRAGDTDLPYIRAANLQDHGLELGDVNSMPYSPDEAQALNLLRGDVLVVEGGAIGTVVALDHDMPGWSFQKTVNRIRTFAGWSPRWIGYVLRTYRDRGVIDVICNGSTIPHLTAEKLRALRVPATPPEEQHRIADYLDEQTSKIDALIAKAEQFIALAKERRAALITAAVTGQIDVTVAWSRI